MYKAEVSNEGDYRFKVKSKGRGFDVGLEAGDITPPDVLLAGLGSCMGVFVRKYAEGARLPLGEFAIRAEADFDKEKPVAFRKIDVFVDLKGAQLDDRRKAALLEFVKNCPVHNTLKASPAIDVRLA